MFLIVLSVLPPATILIYIYYRDRYEKEPRKLLAYLFLIGAASIVPASLIESYVERPANSYLINIAFYAFVGVALVEEGLKYTILWLGIWKRKEFNQLFDGIVYSIFISLGFASVENVIYIYSNGVVIGVIRSLTAIPGHAAYAVAMGYYFGLAKFKPRGNKSLYIFLGILVPVILHGLYDFLLMSGIPILTLLFIPYMIYLFIDGIRKTNKLADNH